MADVTMTYWGLGTALCIFTIGLIGFLTRRNLLIALICIELMLNGANLVFVSFSKLHQTLDGQVLVLFSMTVAAAEAAVGLSILILLFRKTKSVFVDEHYELKG